MATKKWTGEGAAVGVNLNTTNQGASDPLTIATSTTASTVRATNTAGEVLVGTQSLRVHCVAGEVAYGKYVESGTVTAKGMKARFSFATAPTANILIATLQAGSGSAFGIQLRTDGRLAVLNSSAGTTIYNTPAGNTGTISGNSAAPFPTGEFTIDGWADLGTTGNLNTGDGEALVNFYRHATSSSTPWQTSGALTGQNFASKGTAVVEERFGCLSLAAADFSIDDISVVDGRTLQGTYESPVAAPVTVAPPAESQIATGTKPTITMSVTNPGGATLTPSWVAVSAPAGATLPTVTYPTPGDQKTMSTSANLTVPGEYRFRPSSNGVDGALASLFVANADGTSVVMSTTGPLTGTAAALNNTSATDYMETTANPVGVRQVSRMSPKLAGSAVRVTPGGYRNPADGKGVHVTVQVLAGAGDSVVKTFEFDAATADEDKPFDLLTSELAAFSTAGGYNRWAVATQFDQLP